LLGQAAIMRYVARHGIPMEQIVQTRDDADSTSLDGRGILVTSFLEGALPRRIPDTLRHLGESIGLLHALPSTPAGDPLLSRRAGAMPRDDLSYGLACLDRVAGRVPAHLRPDYDALRHTLATIRTCEDLPPACHGLLHNDCHLANAIQRPEGTVAWFDWDGAGHGPSVAAFGLLLYTCALQAPDERQPAHTPVSRSTVQERVAAILTGYAKHHHLTEPERDHLADAIRFRPAVVAARELAESIEHGTAPYTTAWWARYAEAEVVADVARQVLS
jgi:Ser/Thr protein kinase RdoA (MazF antagonist)